LIDALLAEQDVGGISAAILEKDIHVTDALRALSAIAHEHVGLVFCGGTSLSKAHSIIERTLLDIAFHQRKTFAYACEAYSRILAMTQGPEARQAALERHMESELPPDERVDQGQYLAILAEAVHARNGWRCIWKRCAP